MKILDKIKEIWNRLGEPDVDMPTTEQEMENILKSAGLNSNNKKEVVKKVETKPVEMKDIIPEPTADLEKEER